MAVLLDRNEVAIKPGGRAKGRFDVFVLKEEQSKPVLYRKLESQNPDISDTQTDTSKVWVQQYTGMPSALKDSGVDPRILVKDDLGNEGAIKEDDGFILTFHGTYAGERALDERGIPISIDQAEEFQELTGKVPNKFNLWEFRLHEVVITDGPERRAKLMESAEEQRNKAEDKMLTSLEKAFSAMAAKMGGEKVSVKEMATSPEDLIKYLAGIDEEQRTTLFTQAEIFAENKVSASKGKK